MSTGMGGIFFTSADLKKCIAWYQKHLGLQANAYSAAFEWYEMPDTASKAQTQWTPFKKSNAHFASAKQDFMINYRVNDVTFLVSQLKKKGVKILDII